MNVALLRRQPVLNFELKRMHRLRLAGSLVAGPIVVFVALFTAHPELSPALRYTAGALLIGAGVGLRLWAIGTIDGKKKCVLVTWGPYRFLRHPLYCGSLLLVLGFCVLVASITAGAVAGVFFLLLYRRALRVEERFLSSQFGQEWEEYRRRVPALVPRIRSAAPREPVSFRLRRPIRETGALLLLAIAAFGASELVRRLHVDLGVPGWFF